MTPLTPTRPGCYAIPSWALVRYVKVTPRGRR
jgi:hypothetical protein